MMIAIPNMSKPKSCKECELFYIEFYMGENKMGGACTLNDDDGSTIEADYNSCPLIEIDLVRCGECMRRKKNGFCLEHNRYERNDDGFCSYGERKEE